LLLFFFPLCATGDIGDVHAKLPASRERDLERVERSPCNGGEEDKLSPTLSNKTPVDVVEKEVLWERLRLAEFNKSDVGEELKLLEVGDAARDGRDISELILNLCPVDLRI